MGSSFLELETEAARRWNGISTGDRPWIRIGTALCGKAAGCDDVIGALESILESQGTSALVTQVGCLGLCYAEPLLDVQFPGGPRIFYGNVTPESVNEIVASHVVGGAPVDRLALGFLAPDKDEDFEAPEGMPNLAHHPMRALENRIALRNAGNIDPLDIFQYVASGGTRPSTNPCTV